MKQNKALKYRLYPTEEQKILLSKTFRQKPKVWNLMLADKTANYNANGTMLTTTPAQYKTDYPFLKEVDSLALANVQLQLQQAYKNFFRDKKVGFPKYKSKHRSKRSYTTNNQKGSVRLLDKAIRLPKLGDVKAKIHRQPPEDWILKSATVSQHGDGSYQVSVLFEYDTDITPKAVTEDKVVGLDYKSDGLYTDSNGHPCDMHHWYRLSQKKLAKAQRKLKHKTIGSRNYNKQQKRIAKMYRHTANQRKDFLHKESAAITKQFDFVCVEDLNMRAMANKGFGNGKATMDNGYGMFLSMLEYKLADRGGRLVRVDRFFPSSQMCNHCGSINPALKDLSIRKWDCPNCGIKNIDRDINAAINIKREGLRLLTA